MKKDSTKKIKGLGSFSIAQKAIDVLLESRATAFQIGAYLTLARFTSADNQFSTASSKAIYNATGASNAKGSTADRLLSELCSMSSAGESLVYTADSWRKKSQKNEIPDISHGLHSVRYVLNDFGDEQRVWFPNSLVDGIGKFTQPLKRLKQLGDVAARLMLLMYARDNMIEYGGIPPYQNVYNVYETSPIIRNYGVSFWRAERTTHIAYADIYYPALGLKEVPENPAERGKAMQPFWEAFYALDNQGFINEVITVMDGEPNTPDSRPRYILQTKERHGLADDRLDLAGIIDRITKEITGESAADTLGRFNGQYTAITEAGEARVVGIYRLRFRVSNKHNFGVQVSWGRIWEDRNQTAYMLTQLAERAGITTEITIYPPRSRCE